MGCWWHTQKKAECWKVKNIYIIFSLQHQNLFYKEIPGTVVILVNQNIVLIINFIKTHVKDGVSCISVQDFSRSFLANHFSKTYVYGWLTKYLIKMTYHTTLFSKWICLWVFIPFSDNYGRTDLRINLKLVLMLMM